MLKSNEFLFTSQFSNNAVIILDALSDTDLQTARRLSDDLLCLTLSDGTPYCRYVRIESADELLDALETIRHECERNLKPIIHFEAHGSKEEGLQIGASGEYVSWQEISDQLVKINSITKNNLGIVMAACFGLYAISPIKLTSKAPFYFLIGASNDVSAGYIDEAMCRFYRKLFDLRSLDDAMTEVDNEFKQFHSERFFCVSFGKYIRRACMGRGAANRVERLVSKVFDSGTPRNRENLRKIRRSAKTFVKSSQRQHDAFARLARNFLHGRVSMSFEDFENFVKGSAAER